jgi:autotransporter-associated beta strand protein
MHLPRPVSYALVLIPVLLSPTVALGQNRLSWDFTYQDAANEGFNDPAQGTARRGTLTAVNNYLATIIDSRGTIGFSWQPSKPDPGNGVPNGFLAFAGTNFSWQPPNSLLVGQVFRQASGNIPGGTVTGTGRFNFQEFNWFATGEGGTGTPAGNQVDLYSVALHEMTHAMHFLSVFNSDGSSEFGTGTYTRYDGLIYRGATGTAGKQLNAAGTSYTGTLGDLTSNDIWWGGEFGVAANGGNRIQLHAPSTFNPGSSIGHVREGSPSTNWVMSPQISFGEVSRTYTGQEIGMLLDLGWNNYDWNGTTGNWSDGASSLTGTRWQNSAISNVNDNRVRAPVGEVTHNMVLTFGGTSSFTSHNDLTPAGGKFKLNRMRLQGDRTGTIQGNPLLMSNDNNFNVTPMIEHRGTSAFFIHNAIDIPKGLIVGGSSDFEDDGTITIGPAFDNPAVNGTGVISGAGALIKQGDVILTLAAVNTYTGGTTISRGQLVIGTANAIPDTGTVTLSGGVLNTGGGVEGTGLSDTVGPLKTTGDTSTIDLASQGDHVLTFSGLDETSTGALIVDDWYGNPRSPGEEGRIIFLNLENDPNSFYAAWLSQVQFTNAFKEFPAGGFFLDVGGGAFELTPTPEPTTVLALGAAGLGALGAIRRFRRRRADTGSTLAV